MDRDENAARNLIALAAACMTGTKVAADQEAQASKPHGADQKTRATRATRRSRKATARRAGGAIPHQRTEAKDRTQAEALTLWGRTFMAERSGLLRFLEDRSNGEPAHRRLKEPCCADALRRAVHGHRGAVRTGSVCIP